MTIPGRLWQPEQLWRVEVTGWEPLRVGGVWVWAALPLFRREWFFVHRGQAIRWAKRHGVELSTADKSTVVRV